MDFAKLQMIKTNEKEHILFNKVKLKAGQGYRQSQIFDMIDSGELPEPVGLSANYLEHRSQSLIPAIAFCRKDVDKSLQARKIKQSINSAEQRLQVLKSLEANLNGTKN